MKPLRIVSRLAWRNLWRNHRRTVIMLATIAIGAWAMIFMTALLRGMVNDMVRDAVSVLPGHVQIHHPEYRDDPNVVNAFGAPDEALLATLEGPQVRAWTGRIRVPAVVSSARESRSVTLLGVDPVSEARVAFIGSDVSAGRHLESVADDGIVIGRKLAATLGTDLGKRIVVMSQDPQNEIADRGFRVVGLYEASPDSLEERFIFTGIEAARRFLRMDDRIHEVAVLGDDFRDVEPLLATVRAGAAAGLSVLPWNELDVYLGSMLGVMDGFVLVWIVVVFLALSFGLVNTLVMAVFERVREIGLMLALGMKPVLILLQIILESVLLLVIGLAIGNALAWLSIAPLADGIDLSVVAEGMEQFGASPILYPELTAGDVATANGIVILLGIVASISPALRASRYQPIEALTRT